MGALTNLMLNIRKAQIELNNSEFAVKDIKEKRVNPDYYLTLLSDPDVNQHGLKITFPKESATVMGIPIIEDDKVKTFKIITPKDDEYFQ